MRIVENIWEFWWKLLAINGHTASPQGGCAKACLLHEQGERHSRHTCLHQNQECLRTSDQMPYISHFIKLKNTAACCQTSLKLVQLHRSNNFDCPTSCLLILLSKARCFQVDMMDDEELLELVELETREMTGAQYTWFFLRLDDQLSNIINVQSVSSPQLGYTHTQIIIEEVCWGWANTASLAMTPHSSKALQIMSKNRERSIC